MARIDNDTMLLVERDGFPDVLLERDDDKGIADIVRESAGFVGVLKITHIQSPRRRTDLVG